jgi:thymidylate kinase
MPDSKRIAVVGIDGAGKSTVIRRIAERAAGPGEAVLTMTCPAYHLTRDAPLADLSRALAAFSRAGDALGSFELKLVAMYLQMTLYGPVERFLLDTYRPRLLLSEHHALIDTLAYGFFYAAMVGPAADRAALEPRLRAELAAADPDAWAAIEAWHRREGRRLGRELPLWEVARQARAALDQPWPAVIAELERRYRTRLPDAVLLLDLPVTTALERLARRDGARGELHERAGFLHRLRDNYQRVFDALARHQPEVATYRVDSGDDADLDRALAPILDALSPAPAATPSSDAAPTR